MTLFDVFRWMPSPGQRKMLSPRIVLPSLPGCRSITAVAPLLRAFMRMMGCPANPGWVVPSRITRLVILVRDDPKVIVLEPAGRILKPIVAPPTPFASWIAARRVQVAAVELQTPSLTEPEAAWSPLL